MFCPHCGAPVKDGARFCEGCGAPVSSAPAQSDGFYGYDDGVSRLAPGYSRKIDDERVKAALKKQARIVRVVSALFIVLPLVGLPLYASLSHEMTLEQGFASGFFVSLLIVLALLIAGIKKKLTKSVEGIVADKRIVRRLRRSARSGSFTRRRWLVWIDCDDGKRRKKEAHADVYEYLNIGDRVRFLPQFPQPFEKYDKSRDTEIPCMFCSRMNPVDNDECAFCHNLLIK